MHRAERLTPLTATLRLQVQLETQQRAKMNSTREQRNTPAPGREDEFEQSGYHESSNVPTWLCFALTTRTNAYRHD